eukprot:scaffold13436_cov73-Skeletonema_dohrnii-CCMP3373.AAC.2
MDNSSDDDKKRSYSKRGVEKCDYSTECICCDRRCDSAMAALRQQNVDRYAYFVLPKKPRPEEELTNPPNKTQKQDRENKSRKHIRMLQALPSAARQRINDDAYSSNTKFVIASLHFPDEVYNLCKRDGKGNRRLCDSIPSELANALSNKSSSETYTQADMYKDGSGYIPLPNVPPDVMFARGDSMRADKKRAAECTPAAATKKTRNSPVTAEAIEVGFLRETAARDAAQKAVQMRDLQRREQEVLRKQKAAKETMEQALRMQQEATRKLQLCIVENEAYGPLK